jgi:hypothetical protein
MQRSKASKVSTRPAGLTQKMEQVDDAAVVAGRQQQQQQQRQQQQQQQLMLKLLGCAPAQ